MDKEKVEARIAEYEAEQKRLEATLLRLQGAIIALRELLKEDEPTEGETK